MKLSIGIVGLPNVGKSTLFNALTKNEVPAENYPFCTIDPSVGIVPVPDERLKQLSEFSNSEETIPAVIEFVDIAGLVEGAAKGEGLGNKFLANIREVDSILHLVRIFSLNTNSGKTINHVYGSIDPLRDIKVINMELILSDLETIEKRLASVERVAKRNDKEAVKEKELLEKFKATLEEENMANSIPIKEDEIKIVNSWHLLTNKPILYGINKSQNAKNLNETDPEKWNELLEYIKEQGSEYVLIDASIENDLKDLEDNEKQSFRNEISQDKENGINNLIAAAYKLLGLVTFFTTGPKETRAWTIEKGETAKQAGSAIHTDFTDKFIRADVIHWKTLLESGSYPNAKKEGKIKTVGKEHIVADGDVVEFKI